MLEIPKEKGSVWCGLEHYIGIFLLVFFLFLLVVWKEGEKEREVEEKDKV